MVRADERAYGAELAGRNDLATDRLLEAATYAIRAAQAQAEVEISTAELAEEILGLDIRRRFPASEGRFRSRLSQIDPSFRFPDVLPRKTLSILRRAGITTSDLDIPIERSALLAREELRRDPLGTVARSLREAGQASGSFGEVLATRTD